MSILTRLSLTSSDDNHSYNVENDDHDELYDLVVT